MTVSHQHLVHQMKTESDIISTYCPSCKRITSDKGMYSNNQLHSTVQYELI